MRASVPGLRPGRLTSKPSLGLHTRAGVMTGVVLAVLATVLLPSNGAAADDATAARLRVAQINPDEVRPPENGGQPDTKARGPFVLVTFPLSTPDGVADEVAVQYRIQPITRYVSSLLGRRIVLYRMLENGDVDRLIAALRTDRRIANVQLNWEYLALPNGLPPPLVSGPPARAPSQASADRRHPPAAAQPEPGKASGARKAHSVSTRQAMADAAGTNRTPQRSHSTDASSRRSAALGNELRWPTADEPFIGPTTR